MVPELTPSLDVPPLDAAAHLDGLLRRFAAKLERFRCVQSGDLGRELQLTRWLAAHEAEIHGRRSVTDPEVLPIELLRQRFGLSDLDVEVLVGAAAPSLDLAIGATLVELAGEPGQPDVGLLRAVLATDPVTEELVEAALAEHGQLVATRLVLLGPARPPTRSCSALRSFTSPGTRTEGNSLASTRTVGSRCSTRMGELRRERSPMSMTRAPSR